VDVEKTLRELFAEAKANENVFKAEDRTTLRSSPARPGRHGLSAASAGSTW
jgi:hypothetical protein